MSLARCGRIARLSLGSIRPSVAVSARFHIPRAPLARGLASSSPDAQQKVEPRTMDNRSPGFAMLTDAADSLCLA